MGFLMLRWKQRAWVGGAAALCWFARLATANAQIDTNPPLQNVMLLVDTSGSMEFAVDGSKVTCDQVDSSLSSTEPKGASTKSRWTQLVEVLTGDVQDYSCLAQDRAGAAFRAEYKLGSADAYDFNYHLPYHRILSGTSLAGQCTVGPGIADTNPFSWGTTPFRFHRWNDPNTLCTNFLQSSTGLLDSYRDRIRFGLMTFDTSIDAGTGLAGSATADYASGNAGTWSYFLNWRSSPTCDTNSSCAKGRPAGCAASSPMEVGARNAAAPPWEGRMIPFGTPAADVTGVRTTNDHIQQTLLAVRPFGATPINGLLSDARDFFRSDPDDDYTTSSTCDNTTGAGCFGPRNDIFAAQGCRKNFMILLTDGEPNLDLRPYCEGTSGGLAGACPYTDKSFEIVSDLANPASGKPAIKTYVVGFAVSSVDTGNPTPVDCSQISTKGTNGAGDTFDPAHLCDPATMKPSLSACCTLAKIAFYGGTTNPFFATNSTQLRSAIADILRSIGQTVSTRTAPVFASSSSPSGGGFSFFSSFRADPASVWTGVLERQRTECVPSTSGTVTVVTPIDQTIDTSKGDRFSDNVNAADGSHPRLFYTTIAGADLLGVVHSERTIRPTTATTDGLGGVTGTQVSGSVTDFLPPKVPATAMAVSKAACTDKPLPASDDACAAMFMRWEMATTNAPYTTRDNAMGAIYHSTPTLVTAPNEFLRDESYTAFTDLQLKRPPILYTATTDGELHAFKVDISPNDPNDAFTINKKVNNELWAFIPPAALPQIPSQYPGNEQVIVDGVPVVKDVVFVRSDADAKSGGSGASWSTVLVAGYGGGGTGYYALDITNPVPTATGGGPKFLWQLTTDSTGARLFGKRSGTPAIATLFFDPDGGDNAKEYAVAILPGGQSDGPTAATCDQLAPVDLVDRSKLARSKVKCWANDPARSLTIVRLDNGQVIRSFRSILDGPASMLPLSRDTLNRYTVLDAPVSGQPVAFPATTGTVADRAFVGDQDGLMWRLDLHSTHPKDWAMQLFFDAYTGQSATAGQPIATPPILSVDRVGNVTIDFSTGDQDTFLSTTGMQNYIWSLLESPSTSPAFQSKAQWWLPLADGVRVSGPMSLFATSLFYTTFTPPATQQTCALGQSQVCGVHYLNPMTADDGTVLQGKGGAAAVPLLNTKANPCLSFGSTIIFGAGITQKPTCSTDQTFNDPYLGGGTHYGLGGSSGGSFKLIVQTGPGGSSESGGEIHTHAIDLAPPMSTTRVDSWAAVVE
jgi:type IV pilus assembly protein PilY1